MRELSVGCLLCCMLEASCSMSTVRMQYVDFLRLVNMLGLVNMLCSSHFNLKSLVSSTD